MGEVISSESALVARLFLVFISLSILASRAAAPDFCFVLLPAEFLAQCRLRWSRKLSLLPNTLGLGSQNSQTHLVGLLECILSCHVS